MKFLIPINSTSKVSVFVIWLFHVCGIIGISYGNKDLFLSFTPVNLIISFFLLFVNQIQITQREILSVFTIFLIGMICEILGVNYGYIFGDYVYLDNLGTKVFGVPILIGINWIILTFITGSISSYIFKKNLKFSILFGAIFMILLDLIIEPVAPLLGFWIFDLPSVPLQNYVGWFLIGLATQFVYQKFVVNKEIPFSTNLLLANIVFFSFLNFQEI